MAKDSKGIKYPVHISVPLDDHKIDWLTVKCNNESQLKQALLDSHANSELFGALGIGDTAVDFAELQKAQGKSKSPPNLPYDKMDTRMEEFSEMTDMKHIIEEHEEREAKVTGAYENVKYKGKSKHYYNRQINDVCKHDNHISSNCSDCFDEQIYQQLAVDRAHRKKFGLMSSMEWLKLKILKLKQTIKAYHTKCVEERAYNDYMSR